MARYLVVAEDAFDGPDLTSRLRDLAAGDPHAEFDLIVPAAPVRRYVSEAREDVLVAQNRAVVSAAGLRARGLRVGTAQAGAPDLVDAIRDAVREGAGYTAIVVSTAPSALSRRLHVDALSRARRVFGSRLIDVPPGRSPGARGLSKVHDFATDASGTGF